MSEAEDALNRDLECLRLASDFMQLSREALAPELQAHCIRMAEYWSEQINGGPKQDAPRPDDSDRRHDS